MTIDYAMFIGLLSALDEHCKGILPRKRLIREIYWHYMKKYGWIVAINYTGNKALLQDYGEAGKKTLKCNFFVHFMDYKPDNKKRNGKNKKQSNRRH